MPKSHDSTTRHARDAEEEPLEAEAFESEESEPEELTAWREPIAALPAWCSACYGSTCKRCQAVCPTQAISLSPVSGPSIDEALCTRCGLCAGVCDAFIQTRYTLADLFQNVVRNAQEEGGIYFTCNEYLPPAAQPRDNVIVLPCLAALPPEFWAAVMAEGIELNMYCDFTLCHDCSVAGQQAPTLFKYALQTAQQWMSGEVYACRTLPEKGTVLETLSHIDEDDRRGLFSALAREGKDIASGQHRKRNSGTTSGFHEQQDRLRAEGRIKAAAISARASTPQKPLSDAAFSTKHPWDRQALLVTAVQKRPDRAATIRRYCTTTNEELCCHTLSCISACPTGARSLDTATNRVCVDAKLCIACGACVATCPTGACTFKEITAQEYCLPSATKG